MTKQELVLWICEFANAPAYPEVMEAINTRINSVIQTAIEEHEARNGYMLKCDYCGCHPSVIYKTNKGSLCKKCNGIG